MPAREYVDCLHTWLCLWEITQLGKSVRKVQEESWKHTCVFLFRNNNAVMISHDIKSYRAEVWSLLQDWVINALAAIWGHIQGSFYNPWYSADSAEIGEAAHSTTINLPATESSKAYWSSVWTQGFWLHTWYFDQGNYKPASISLAWKQTNCPF